MKVVIFFLLFFSPITLFARPDLIINNIGDNTYGDVDTGKGGSITYYNGEIGKFNEISVIIQNDNISDNNSEIYYINAKLPDTSWKYYFEYNGIKYEGEWATNIIKPGEFKTFKIYIKPPDSINAITYPIIINATKDNLSDSFLINFNVIQMAKFDLVEIKDNDTVGNGIFETYVIDKEKEDIFLNYGSDKTISFQISNIGNINGEYYLEFYSSFYKNSDFDIYLNNKNVTEQLKNRIFRTLKSGDNDTLTIYVDSNKISKEGSFFIKIYDSDLNLVDSFQVNINLISSKNNVNYIFPANTIEDNEKSYILVVNGDSNTENISVTDNSSNIQISPYNIFIREISNGHYGLTGTNFTIPIIVNFDPNYCVKNIEYPIYSKFIGKIIIFPIMIKYNDNSTSILIYNPLNLSKTFDLVVYKNNGEKIFEKNYNIAGNETKNISINDLNIEENYGLYWISVISDSDISGSISNKFGNCYIYYKGISTK